jgi:citrate lyase beta subunit
MSAEQLRLAHAHSFLFVPASRPERIAKAIATGADVVIVDLEDAVAPADKPSARAALRAWLAANPGERVIVRVNAAATAWHEDDLAACRHEGIVGLLLPKAESTAQVAHAFERSGKSVLPIIETGAGLECLKEIGTAPGCARLVFGKLDLAVELDLVPDEADPEELVFLPYRAMLVLASKRAGLPAPVDGVFTVIGDPAAFSRYAQRARRHGFGGVLLIHPAQVAPVTVAFTPSPADIEWAQAVLAAAAAAGGGAAVLDQRMIDAPVIARAERILAAAKKTDG